MTGKQKRDIRDLLHDALDEFRPNKDQAQKVLGNGGRLKAGVKELLAKLSASGLLEPVSTVTVPAIETFGAKEHFKDDRSGPVVIGFIGSNFRRTFLAGEGKIETNITETTLRIHKLVRASVDGPILAELGGEETAETALAQMYELMKAQGQGQKGNLLTNGNANIFYIRDANGTLWAVDCSWHSDNRCWHVHAYSVTNPDTWYEGDQVVSR